MLTYLNWKPYAIGVLAVILVGGIQQARVMRLHYLHTGAVAELAQQREAWAEASRAGHQAAREAVEAAIVRERESEAQRRASEDEAAARLRMAAEAAAKDAADWRRRYREAAANNPSCAAWSAEIVKCPTG